MKKIVLLCLCLVFCLPLFSCGKSDTQTLKPGIYKLENAAGTEIGSFTITCFSDGTFTCSESPLSSYFGIGTYSISGDTLTLTENGAGQTGEVRHFTIGDGTISYISKGSDPYHFIPLGDGDTLKWVAAEETEG